MASSLMLVVMVAVTLAMVAEAVKPGTCPPAKNGTIGICVNLCAEDEECDTNLKCCFNGCSRICQVPAINSRQTKDPIAPPTARGQTTTKATTLTDTASVNGTETTTTTTTGAETTTIAGTETRTVSTTGTKTGNKATPTATGSAAEKPGKCPASPANGPCDNNCADDSDCEGQLKCCVYACGLACMPPVTDGDQSPVPTTTLVEEPTTAGTPSIVENQPFGRATPTGPAPGGLRAVPFRCLQNQEKGTCDQTLPRWYFDVNAGKCTEFVYTGCQGNDNNFETLDLCQSTCTLTEVPAGTPCPTIPEVVVPHPTCQLLQRPPVNGCPVAPEVSCPNNVPATPVNTAGNTVSNSVNDLRPAPIFSSDSTTTMARTVQKAPYEVCMMSPMTGPCNSYTEQWFYDYVIDACHPFVYGGCMGNNNRFASKIECERMCKNETTPTTTTTTTTKVKLGECPGPMFIGEKSDDQCKADGECEGYDKCCHNGKNHICTKMTPMVKPGFCPAPIFPKFGVCISTCESDFECKGSKKCCFNGCGYTCVKSSTAKACDLMTCPPCQSCVETIYGAAKCVRSSAECCPDGTLATKCTTDPCATATCPTFPTARCVADFCGGCNASFYDDDGNMLDCEKGVRSAPSLRVSFSLDGQ